MASDLETYICLTFLLATLTVKHSANFGMKTLQLKQIKSIKYTHITENHYDQ
jgi:hypothetical protein